VETWAFSTSLFSARCPLVWSIEASVEIIGELLVVGGGKTEDGGGGGCETDVCLTGDIEGVDVFRLVVSVASTLRRMAETCKGRMMVCRKANCWYTSRDGLCRYLIVQWRRISPFPPEKKLNLKAVLLLV